MDDEELERRAAEELLKEAKRGVARAEMAGSMAWLPGTIPSTDKRFLANTLRHTLAANRLHGRGSALASAAAVPNRSVVLRTGDRAAGRRQRPEHRLSPRSSGECASARVRSAGGGEVSLPAKRRGVSAPEPPATARAVGEARGALEEAASASRVDKGGRSNFARVDVRRGERRSEKQDLERNHKKKR
ncbi:uncharacterized protein LOC119099132 [Pollicipes pollicipes]|uniref:uncharacterized protein LOC119099132 n=1 Tax=Pollicipes pollicipes TaxID=41117 RepID=UPI001884E6E9|nr:uncharacterized protein LOC119099132 [Pollicipes pollicipes]